MSIIRNGQEWGITKKGLRLPRAADYLEHMIGIYEAETNETVDRSPDSVIFQLLTIKAEQLGKNTEHLQDIFDSRDPDIATGHSLDVLAGLVGLQRFAATKSSVVLELSGDPGITVPAGKQVEDTNRQRWTLVNNATVGAGGTVMVEALANETGHITADAGTITKIHTPIAGWLGVTNPAAAVPGRARETDTELRRRRQLSTQIQGGSSRAAIRARLLALDFIRSAEVFHNPTDQEKTVAGVVAPPHTVVAYVFSIDGGELQTNEQRFRVAEVLFRSVAATVMTAGTGETVNITSSDGVVTPVKWSYAQAVPVNVTITITGAEPADIQEELEGLFNSYFDGLLVGEDVRLLQILALVAQVPTITGATVLLNGSAQDVEIEDFQFAEEGSLVVTA